MGAGFDMKAMQKGFTLIEIMIVVAIVAILAAIAFPSYARYVEQARRADAKSALLDAAQRLERCHTQFGAYDNGACPTFPLQSPDQHYAITVQRTAMTFTLTATPQGVQANSPCGAYSTTNTGVRTVTGSLGVDRCW
jgi:type IV pilus assembly protein PilE